MDEKEINIFRKWCKVVTIFIVAEGLGLLFLALDVLRLYYKISTLTHN